MIRRREYKHNLPDAWIYLYDMPMDTSLANSGIGANPLTASTEGGFTVLGGKKCYHVFTYLNRLISGDASNSAIFPEFYNSEFELSVEFYPTGISASYYSVFENARGSNAGKGFVSEVFNNTDMTFWRFEPRTDPSISVSNNLLNAWHKCVVHGTPNGNGTFNATLQLLRWNNAANDYTQTIFNITQTNIPNYTTCSSSFALCCQNYSTRAMLGGIRNFYWKRKA